MSGDKKWNTENTCKLIELYREHSILWDPKNKDYKNRYKKADALKEISLSLNVPLNDVDKKIRILTTSMLEKEEIIRNLKNLGQGSISLQNGLDMNC
nr:unnamed protein product [Callosobruchus chinensis]CAH7762688.1 unnamed protein product [Callosobruchus chinensis]